ncbi:hypothetical protein PAESOLCIP111_01265 [Paenibacillus solanacearum]|uniref:Major facilitator superfamily (MFS) profile domain-containing protein n=1 Tax=Paenibacillus solanacearum TaxID=2048548 RepID=A0A916JWV0_9BACL|nr:MFS transporter [Paenibacillus solanacearum]CAG7610636.1 hypothetical protein PAESOLCIP111_01265 [Paenibacillus solanacearum]
MKVKFVVMFLIVLCGMNSIAAFNPVIGPLSRHLGLSEIQSGAFVSVTGLCWLLGGYFWERRTFMRRKAMLSLNMLIYVAALVAFALLADISAKAERAAGLFWIFLLLRGIAGFSFGGIPAQAQAYVMGWTTQDTRTRGMALFGAANGLGFVLGPAMSGGMAPMYAAAVLLFAMVILLLVVVPNEASDGMHGSEAPLLSVNDARIRLYIWSGLILSVALNIVQVTIGFRLASC